MFSLERCSLLLNYQIQLWRIQKIATKSFLCTVQKPPYKPISSCQVQMACTEYTVYWQVIKQGKMKHCIHANGHELDICFSDIQHDLKSITKGYFSGACICLCLLEIGQDSLHSKHVFLTCCRCERAHVTADIQCTS